VEQKKMIREGFRRGLIWKLRSCFHMLYYTSSNQSSYDKSTEDYFGNS